MLQITIPNRELYDERKDEFIDFIGTTLQLEHSLVSLSKWESKWRKPFLVKETHSYEETVDYIRCMTLTQHVPEFAYNYISDENIIAVKDYIEDPMTATTILNEKKATNRDIITAEIIYYWMITLTIPFECQKWHLNRLLTLINVVSIKNQPPSKMGRQAIATRNRELNAARRKELNTKG